MKKYAIWILITTQIFILVVLVQPENRISFKQLFIRVDSVIFKGIIRRQYHNQKLPRMNKFVVARTLHDYAWLEGQPFIAIAHGLGPTLYGGDNTMKTLEKGRERGFEVFEVDVALTLDNVLVCYHGGEDQEINSTLFADYLAFRQAKQHAPCRFDDIVSYARKNPKVYFVLDVKNRFYETYGLIKKAIGGKELSKSFIPQIYDFEQLSFIRENSWFAGEIFTSYRSALTSRQIFDYANKFEVKVVTLTKARLLELNGNLPTHLSIFTHPVNDPFEAANIKKIGVRGIYTSYIAPQSIPEVF